MINRIWAIALNTFREAARIRVLYGILVLVVGANLFAVAVGKTLDARGQRGSPAMSGSPGSRCSAR